MTDQMLTLREALDSKGYSWIDASDPWLGMQRTHFTNKHGDKCSVICGSFSYGGEGGLLESMPPVHISECEDEWQDEVEGWLTADEIIKEWL